ncbi:PREDICTED: leucine-rich repeat-containing protein 49 isoform X2 [Miniopterus natalensis]|uniref:leucine-rich repeat-containing protein 49 isoform X2 n=1 Tax=Miniopterus natalensis TaxID=291302 RepID=UPI0007A6C2A3|nr:PREDICTED: leucine-rich repeat-containing protein 49 isoform X2 [Miniopterus natalensis]
MVTSERVAWDMTPFWSLSLYCSVIPNADLADSGLSPAMIPGKYRSVSGRAANNVNCGLHLVVQTSSLPEKNKVEFRLSKETPSFPGRLLQHDLERNYSSRQGDGRVISPSPRNKSSCISSTTNVTELCGLDMKTTMSSLSAFGDSSIQIPSKSRIRQGCHSAGPNVSGDHINLVSSSMPSFPILQRSSEEKILYSDRLTLERQKLTVCPVIDGEEHLRLLNFQHNFITRIQNISNLRRLIFLDLYDNHIEEISGLSTLRSLRVLLLGKNRIKKISNLENLKSLDVLDLHGNQIAKIENVNHLCDLRVLNLARNLLSHVDNLNGLDSLTELNLRHNQITFVRDVDNLPCLQRLFLSFNNISNFESVCCLADSTSLSDITFDGNPIAQESWYKHTILQNMMQLRQLDMKRVTEEERRMASVVAKKEEEKKRESHKQSLLKEKKRLTINNVARQWDLQHRVTNIATNQDRKDSDSPSQDPCQIDGSTTSSFPEETGSVDTVLTNALQGLSVIDTHLVEVDGDTLSLYGSGALESLDRNWSIQTAGMVTTVSFTFIEFDEIVQVLPKLKMKFPNSLVTQNDMIMAERLFGILAHVASSELPQYRVISILGDVRKKQFRYLQETKGKKPGIVNEENNDSKRFVGENTNRAMLNYTTRDFYNEKLEETKEKKKFCKIYIEDLVKEATEINMKKEALQKLWPQMFIELVRDAVIETRNKNSYMKLCLQQITDQKEK